VKNIAHRHTIMFMWYHNFILQSFYSMNNTVIGNPLQVILSIFRITVGCLNVHNLLFLSKSVDCSKILNMI